MSGISSSIAPPPGTGVVHPRPVQLPPQLPRGVSAAFERHAPPEGRAQHGARRADGGDGYWPSAGRGAVSGAVSASQPRAGRTGAHSLDGTALDGMRQGAEAMARPIERFLAGAAARPTQAARETVTTPLQNCLRSMLGRINNI